MDDGDAGFRRDLGPDLARALGPVPGLAGLLAGHRDEAEIADGGAVGLRVTVDHHDLQPAPRRGERMSEADDTGADDGEIETALHWLLLPGAFWRHGKPARQKQARC